MSMLFLGIAILYCKMFFIWRDMMLDKVDRIKKDMETLENNIPNPPKARLVKEGCKPTPPPTRTVKGASKTFKRKNARNSRYYS